MWYFSWVLGVLFVCSLGIINLLRLEARGAFGAENISIDSLTQLLTKESVLEMLRERVEHSKQNKVPFSLLYISLKAFKNKHQMSDQEMNATLLNVADILINDIRVNRDITAKVGDEDFLIVVRGASKKRADNVADRLKNNVAHHINIRTSIPIEIAIGIAEYSDDSDFFSIEMDEADVLLNRAIRKCFRAKA